MMMILRANFAFAPILFILFAIMTALGSVLFGQALPGVAVGAVVTGVMIFRLYIKSHRGFLTTVLRMSPTGVEWWDGHGFHVRLRWANATRIGEIHTALTKGKWVIRPGGVPLTVKTWKNTGLIGWGEMTVPSQIPGWLRDFVAGLPKNQNGAVEVAIPLGALDPAWSTGHMGAWVHRQRPDLL